MTRRAFGSLSTAARPCSSPSCSGTSWTRRRSTGPRPSVHRSSSCDPGPISLSPSGARWGWGDEPMTDLLDRDATDDTGELPIVPAPEAPSGAGFDAGITEEEEVVRFADAFRPLLV